ncbi:hypothetical protein SAMN04244572_03788 [Azotobacter beijerinckii]|uniref:Uncharacterized protein n=1 Tax=Azotobacter beijerinckii TaxID=170623 RepID=A0A1H6YDH1_9GAMM|nr:hypothetical protein [Azotobacter beijerinckii]SEJ39318.1 hypothetical protein SAMN04244572_03788 [Azotobacter beijerinckii]SER54814.1 hypothetical protein SAMN04244573_03833 [Azotobacter beijerinckii]
MPVTSKPLDLIVFDEYQTSNSSIYNELHAGLSRQPNISSGEKFWYPLLEKLK